MLMGIMMILGALWLYRQNQMEEQQAARTAEAALEEIIAEIRQQSAVDDDGSPEFIEIDGECYIGYLELPTISFSLPVMSEWSYPRLRIAPCRYSGAVQSDDLIIMAHNYDRHFGQLSMLREGDPVQFIDAAGEIHRYVVIKQELLETKDVERMGAGEWDLTLFSCTYGGQSRVTVRLQRVLTFE